MTGNRPDTHCNRDPSRPQQPQCATVLHHARTCPGGRALPAWLSAACSPGGVAAHAGGLAVHAGLQACRSIVQASGGRCEARGCWEQ